MNRPQMGFTLWELMMTLTVGGIVLGLGVPSFMVFQRNNAMTAAANELVTGILLARTEAVKRQVPVTLCGSANPTAAAPQCGGTVNGGFIVFVDENSNGVLTDATDGNAAVDAGEVVLLQRAEPGGTIDVWSDSVHISFGANGFPRTPAGKGNSATQVLFCDDRGNSNSIGGSSAARVVAIEVTGRATVRLDTADVTAAVASIGGDAACS